MSKFEEFLRTSSTGHLAVVLMRGDCVYSSAVGAKELCCDGLNIGRRRLYELSLLFNCFTAQTGIQKYAPGLVQKRSSWF